MADAHRLPFRDGTIASVLSNSTLEHLPGVGDVLREAARVLRASGTLLFTVHNHRFARRMFFWPRIFALARLPGLTERYRRARLRRLLADCDWWRSASPSREGAGSRSRRATTATPQATS